MNRLRQGVKLSAQPLTRRRIAPASCSDTDSPVHAANWSGRTSTRLLPQHSRSPAQLSCTTFRGKPMVPAAATNACQHAGSAPKTSRLNPSPKASNTLRPARLTREIGHTGRRPELCAARARPWRQGCHCHGSLISHHAGHCAAYLERLVRTLPSDAAVSQAAGMWKDTRTVMTGCDIIPPHAPAILTLLVRTGKSRKRSWASARAGSRRAMVSR